MPDKTINQSDANPAVGLYEITFFHYINLSFL